MRQERFANNDLIGQLAIDNEKCEMIAWLS